MQLHRRTGRFGRDRGGRAGQLFDAGDVEVEVLAAGRAHLIVEEGVAVGRRKVGGDQILRAEGRQDSDHHDPRADFGCLPVRVRETGTQLLGQLVEDTAAQPVRDDIHFEIEHPEFRLEIMARDPVENLRIHHPRHAVGAREIEFDLHPHHISRAVEPLLLQQSLQHLQTLLKLPAVPLPARRTDSVCIQLLAHRCPLPPVCGHSGRPGHGR